MLGIDTPEKVNARRDADSRAVGGACRHAGRAIEDCYALNRKADKAAVFAGWREMNDYMRENKIDTVAPQAGLATAKADPDAAAEGDDRPAKSGVASKTRDGKAGAS
ncbi:MAG: hypothetical protein JWP52_1930 [Rhizobacter sp.]|jgi:hypothetical protein|nr:hypothetical protein [Rhizobacter sp.]